MAIKPEVLDALLAAGATAEMIVAAVKADQASENERQEEKRAGNAERQRRFKQRRRDAVTDDNAGNALPPLDDVTGEDSPLSPSPLPFPQTPKPTPRPHTPAKHKPAREACRLPADWAPAPLTGTVAKAVAQWPPGAVERELERFRDWAASTAGENARKKDWDAAWRNWCRKTEDDGLYANRNSTPPSRDKRDGLAKALDRQIAELEIGDASGAAGRSDLGVGAGDRIIADPGPRTL